MPPAKKRLDLIFTRDFSLALCELWSWLITRGLTRRLGMGLSDQVIHFNGRAVECYRLRNDLAQLRKYFTNLPLTTKFLSIDQTDRQLFRKQIRAIRKLARQRPRTRQGMLKNINQCIKLWENPWPRYWLALYFPGAWADDFRERYGKAAEPTLKAFYEDRAFSEGTLESMDLAWRDIIAQVLKRHGIPTSYATLLRLSEVRRFLATNRTPPLRELQARRRGYILAGGKLYVDMPFEKVLDRLGYPYTPPKINRGERHLTGTVAYGRGVLRGRVKIALNYDEVHQFPKGAILVTTMTAPEFIPAMKRAKAIITDEGGLTSHAAIVSRELKIPCIVGTKIATRVLKDGDRVEVDAERGIVRKLP